MHDLDLLDLPVLPVLPVLLNLLDLLVPPDLGLLDDLSVAWVVLVEEVVVFHDDDARDDLLA